MIFSRPCQHAILAMACLAEEEPAHFVSIRQISAETGVPLPYLSKIISSLSRIGLVSARRGPGGGVTLSRPPDEVTVGDVVEAIDGPLATGKCVLGLHECDETRPCVVHDLWKSVSEGVSRALAGQTLFELSRARREKIGNRGRAGPKRPRRRPGNGEADERRS